MEQNQLLKIVNEGLIDKLYQFCYARTSYTTEAKELCSDILYAIVKAGKSDRSIEKPEAYFWTIAHKVYAGYCEKRRVGAGRFSGNGDKELLLIPDRAKEEADRLVEDEEALNDIYRLIANLSKSYREIVIAFYLDGQGTADIADNFGISETAVRQRLFLARQEMRNEVKHMEKNKITEKPMTLQDMEWSVIGTGNPADGDPRDVCHRQLSRHVIWLCRNKPNTARAIADELNVPMRYIEEELETQVYGTNGRYGTLRKTESGRYVTNFILLDEGEIEYLHKLYTEQIPNICKVAARFIENHKEEYLECPYINKNVTLNLILWQQISDIAWAFQNCVTRKLQQKYLADIEPSDRPFSIFGYSSRKGETAWGCGCDGISADDICGYKSVFISNIYIGRIRPHFHCAHNISNDPALRMAIRAINGISVDSLNETEKEVAAKAIEEGYLYREDGMLYTKFLVSMAADEDKPFDITRGLCEYFDEEAETVASKIADFVRKKIPEHLRGDYRYVNSLADLPVLDTLVGSLIEKGMLVPPDNGVGAEGIWMVVKE